MAAGIPTANESSAGPSALTPLRTGTGSPGQRGLVALVVGAVIGAGYFGLRKLVLGNDDPFANGRAFEVWAISFVGAFLIARVTRAPWSSVAGMFLGQMAWLWLVAARVEYPAAATIGMALHGLLPAAGGAVAGWLTGIGRLRGLASRPEPSTSEPASRG
jgi:hypothetical protein